MGSFNLAMLNSIYKSDTDQQIAEKKLDLIFLKIVTKNVRKESVLKLIIRGWI
jgi:hypothetical protein